MPNKIQYFSLSTGSNYFAAFSRNKGPNERPLQIRVKFESQLKS
jgi:hypothetical protein